MLNRCHKCALSIEEQKNFYVCQIRETIEKSPLIFYDGCPFFEPKDKEFEIILKDLINKNE